MLKKIKQYDNQNVVYLIYAMFILASAVTLTSWATTNPDHIVNAILKVISYVSYLGCAVCIVINIAKRKYSKYSFCFLVAMLVAAGIAIITSGERTVFLFVLLLCCVYASDGRTILQLSCLIQGGILVLTVFGAVTGITQNLIVDEERMRYSLGFAWASYAPNLLLFVSMQYMLLRRNQISWLELVGIEACNVFIFLQTDTKMSFLVLTLLVGIAALNRIPVIRAYLLFAKRWLLGVKKNYLVALPWVCALLAILLPLYRQESIFWKILDSGFSGRLELGKNAILHYGFSLFGQDIDMQGFSVLGKTYEVYNYVDSSYLQIAIRYGIVLLVLVCILYGAALLKVRKRNDGRMFLFLIVILFLCMEEPFLFDMAFNLFPVFVLCDEDALQGLMQKVPGKTVLKTSTSSSDQPERIEKKRITTKKGGSNKKKDRRGRRRS